MVALAVFLATSWATGSEWVVPVAEFSCCTLFDSQSMSIVVLDPALPPDGMVIFDGREVSSVTSIEHTISFREVMKIVTQMNRCVNK